MVRPGIVYGGARGIVGDLLKDALNGLVRVVGDGQNHWPCIYDRDLADLYVRVATNPMAAGIFHANDEADERVDDIVDGDRAARQDASRRAPRADRGGAREDGAVRGRAGARSDRAQPACAGARLGADAALGVGERRAAAGRIPDGARSGVKASSITVHGFTVLRFTGSGSNPRTRIRSLPTIPSIKPYSSAFFASR